MTEEWRRAQQRRKTIRPPDGRTAQTTILRAEMFRVRLLRSRSGLRLRLNNNVEIPR